MALGSRGSSRGVEWPDLKGKMEDGDDAQDIQEPEGPKTEVLEVLAVLVDRRLAGADPQGGSESGLEGPSPFLPGVKACCVVRFGRTCKWEREEICFLPDRVSLARVSGNLLAADGEARGASFRTGV